MARRPFSSSRLRSAINSYNRQVREHNRRQKRAVDDYNRKLKEFNRRQRSEAARSDRALRGIEARNRRAIDAYNREVREYNRRVRANHARLQSVRNVVVQQEHIAGNFNLIHESAIGLSDIYDRLNHANADPYLSDLAEQETANSLTVARNLIEPGENTDESNQELGETKIVAELSRVSPDLNDRWHGALFSLSPENPDAARHFCASSRELIAGILNSAAPDSTVMTSDPNCPLTERGTPTRRAKIAYCLEQSGVQNNDLETFIDTNVKDLNVLFQELNAGAHGPAGRFTLSELGAIKVRVEDAIIFMCEISP